MTEVAIIGHSLSPLNLGLCVEALKAEGLIVIQGECEMNSWWKTCEGIFYLDSLVKAHRPTPQKQNQRELRRDARRRAKR